jgi:creatinine amidohydrolase/Fe(II)-dependent formamide hydrolase-like protein
MKRFVEELRPRQIIDVRDRTGIVFIPVSPLYEWHSFHLPLGTDGLIAEGVAAALAEEFDGLCCRCIPIALDELRDMETKVCWGLPTQPKTFGMNFPTLPLESEYHTPELMRGVVAARLKAVKASGFSNAFLVNHHGGAGQNETLQEIAEEFSDETFTVSLLRVPSLNTFHEEGDRFLHLKVGGHAGLSETMQLMAFRPDLVGLDELPEGALSVAETGILHHLPEIPAEFNPHHATQDLADQWRESVLENAAARVRKMIAR